MADTKQVIDILGIITNGLKTGKTLYNDTTCMWLEEAIEHLKEYQKIVKCKDCKHRPREIPFVTSYGDHDTYLEFPKGSKCPCRNSSDDFYSWNPDDDWFCADGEKKEQ